MGLQSQAIADAGGPGMSIRDRLFQVGRIGARVILCLGLPLGFYDRGLVSETLRFVGIWLLISSSQYVANVLEMGVRNMLGRPTQWGTPPAARMKVYALTGVALVLLSGFRLGLSGNGGLRIHWGQLISVALFAGFWAAMAFIVWYAWTRAKRATMGLQTFAPQIADVARQRAYDAYFAGRWNLYLGASTGVLSTKEQEHSFVGNLRVRLGLEDASRGTLVFGAMGSGKTVFLRNCARDAARQGSGLLALSAKPDDATAMVEIARQYREARHVHLVAADGESLNLLAGLSPENVGNAFYALTRDPRSSSYWADSASLMMTGAAQLAWGLTGTTVPLPTEESEPERTVDFDFDLRTIHSLVFGGSEQRIAALQSAADMLPQLRRSDPLKADALESAIIYFTTSFVDLDAKTKDLVKSGLTPYILPLLGGTARRTFCDPDGLNLVDVLEAGHVVVLNPDKARNQKVFSLIAQFAMAHLSDMALRRTARSHNEPVLILLDEYASFASSDHLTLVETARQARLCLVLSSIGVTNLAARLGDTTAKAIPSAFSNLVCFATGDEDTKNLISKRIGRVQLHDISSSNSTSTGSQNGKSTESSSTSYRVMQVDTVDDSVWRDLGVNAAGGFSTAIAIVSESGHSLHDVLRVPAGAQA